MSRDGIDKAIMRSYRDKLVFPVKCEYCGEELTLETVTVEHKIPLIRGGKSVFSNFTVSCCECNREKNCLTHSEYKEIIHRAKSKEERKELIENAIIKIKKEEVSKITGFGQTIYYMGNADEVMPINQIEINLKTQKMMDNLRHDRVLEKIYNEYMETGILNGVIHISKNNTVIRGFTIYAMAKEYGINYLPVKNITGGAFFIRKKNKKSCRVPLKSDTVLATDYVDKMNKGEYCKDTEDYLNNLNFFLEFGYFEEPVYIKSKCIIGCTSVLDIAKQLGIPYIPVKFINSSDEYMYKHA